MIRDAIKEELGRREWTPYRLAKESGVPSTQVYAFLNGERDIMLSSAEAMLTVLNLKVTGEKSRKKA